MRKNTRLIFSAIALLINYLILAVGMYAKIDVVELATALAMLQTPLYGYLFAKTQQNINSEKIKQ